MIIYISIGIVVFIAFMVAASELPPIKELASSPKQKEKTDKSVDDNTQSQSVPKTDTVPSAFTQAELTMLRSISIDLREDVDGLANLIIQEICCAPQQQTAQIALDAILFPKSNIGRILYYYAKSKYAVFDKSWKEASIYAHQVIELILASGSKPHESIGFILNSMRSVAAETNFHINSEQCGEKTMREDFIDYYRLLQVDPSADPKIIDKAWRTLMIDLNVHPDRGGDTKMAQMVNAAHDVLMDPIKRKEYDAQYKKRQTSEDNTNVSSGTQQKTYSRQSNETKHESQSGFHQGRIQCPMCGKIIGAQGNPNISRAAFIRHAKGGKKYGGHELSLAEAERMGYDLLP
jgi:hypothetical protein